MSKITQLLHTDIIAVEVPREATDVSLGSLGVALYFRLDGFLNHILIDSGLKLELLGEATETEISFDLDPYVDKIHFISMFDGKETYNYKNYIFPNHCCLDAKESFYSLLQASGLYFVNPIGGKPRWDQESPSEYPHYFYDHLERWQEAESKVIKGKLIFLKPV